MTTAPPVAARSGRLRRAADLTASGATDILVSQTVGLVLFIVHLTLLAIGIGTAVIGVGLLILVVWVLLARAIGSYERARGRIIHGLDLPAPPRHHTGGNWLRRMWDDLRDRSTWRVLGRNAVGALLGLAAGVLVGSLLSQATVFIVSFARGYTGVPLWSIVVGRPWLLGLALAMIAVAVLICLGFATISRSLDVALLRPDVRAQLRAKVSSLDRQRAGAVGAAEEQRIRLERDLHDGVQPELVNVAMTIDLARRAMSTDPEQAARLMDEAHASSKAAVTTLRQTVRGIHPAVLVDRGLDAALSAIAARAPLPVDLLVDLPRRPGRQAEAAVYFVVSEALTNVAQHAGATRATVRIAEDGDLIRVVVSDDGAGGARLDAGASHTGLRGMRDRLIALGGSFHITSPSGGPTTIIGELPCAS